MRGYEISCVGICEIEQTEKGWYVTLIDKDAETVRREMDSEKKEKMDLDDEQRRQKLIAEQVNSPMKKRHFSLNGYLDQARSRSRRGSTRTGIYRISSRR